MQTFSQLVMLSAGGMLVAALIPLWRKGVPAYISAFRWQSWLLALLTALVGYFGRDPQLYGVAILIVALKGIAMPALLRTMDRRFGHQRELKPYVNPETALLIAGVLVLFAYVLARPWMEVTTLPTRGGLPLAMALLFIALLAVVGTYGVPLLVELGVFLDALMGFLVMQIFVYQIHETFETIDVDQL